MKKKPNKLLKASEIRVLENTTSNLFRDASKLPVSTLITLTMTNKLKAGRNDTWGSKKCLLSSSAGLGFWHINGTKIPFFMLYSHMYLVQITYFKHKSFSYTNILEIFAKQK